MSDVVNNYASNYISFVRFLSKISYRALLLDIPSGPRKKADWTRIYTENADKNLTAKWQSCQEAKINLVSSA
jgi:hypothetical protein